MWLYSGKSAWHFVTLSKKTSARIKSFIKSHSSAWGSVKVLVQVEKFKWDTSVFPDRKIGGFLLPIKKEVRKKLNITEGSKIRGVLIIERGVGFLGL